jgi:glycosyltransferase involved in cell wall biosynthesis
MRHVHILDPQLTGIGGHYFSHDGQLTTELQRRGIEPFLYGRKQSSVGHCAGVPVTPIFTNDIFKEACIDPLVWAMENFNAVNQEFLADLISIDPQRLSADDLVYFPNILQNQVYAVALWLARLPAERRPSVALMFRYLNHAMDYVQTRQNKEMIALLYRYAVRQLVGIHPRTLVCADTTELAHAYKQITGVPMLELPNPMDVSALLAKASPLKSDGRPVVVYQGHTSPLRGFHFLPEIIQRCAALTPRPRFVIQVQNRENAAATGLAPVIAQLDQLPSEHVELINGPLEQEDYLKLLQRADVVLLPYSPTFYGFGSSGVFTEAASVGKVVVACAGTVPARQGRDYQLGVVAGEKWTPQAMAAAVSSALQRLPALRQQAASGAPRYRAENCAKTLWDRLFAAIDGLPNARAAA